MVFMFFNCQGADFFLDPILFTNLHSVNLANQRQARTSTSNAFTKLKHIQLLLLCYNRYVARSHQCVGNWKAKMVKRGRLGLFVTQTDTFNGIDRKQFSIPVSRLGFQDSRTSQKQLVLTVRFHPKARLSA